MALRIDRQLAQRDKLAQDAARSSDGFASEFYGEAISEALFYKPWMPLSSGANRLWK